MLTTSLSSTAPTTADSPPIGHDTACLPLQFVRQPAYRLSAPNLGQSPEELDSGADFFQAEGAKARERDESKTTGEKP